MPARPGFRPKKAQIRSHQLIFSWRGPCVFRPRPARGLLLSSFRGLTRRRPRLEGRPETEDSRCARRTPCCSTERLLPELLSFCSHDPNQAELLNNWGTYVKSWCLNDTKTLIVRFEDMQREPVATFKRIADKLGFDVDNESVTALLSEISFDRVSALERTGG